MISCIEILSKEGNGHDKGIDRPMIGPVSIQILTQKVDPYSQHDYAGKDGMLRFAIGYGREDKDQTDSD